MSGQRENRVHPLRAHGLAYVLVAPTFLLLLVFVLYPAFRSLYMSLFDFNAFMTHKNFVGLANYSLLLSSPEYWQSLSVTALFLVFSTVPIVILSLAIALALDANPFFRNFLRTMFLMPVAISSAMAAMLWVFIFNPSSGYLNFLLEFARISGPNWLGDPAWALMAVTITTVWKEVGFNVIFFVAGLSSISTDLREAAMLDGAGAWQIFRNVTLPLLAPTIFFVCVVSVLNSFQSFGQIHILTGGGPAGATNTMVYNLYRDAFQNFQTGSASAQAVILFALMLIVTIIQFRIARTNHAAEVPPASAAKET